MDHDGLTQAEEEDIHNTSDTLYDTDGDGHSDGEEVNSGTDPTNPQSIPVEQIKILDFTVDGQARTIAIIYPNFHLKEQQKLQDRTIKGSDFMGTYHWQC